MNNPKEETVESVNLNFGYFQVYIFLNVIFQISTLEFIKNEFLTNTVNFCIWSNFPGVPGWEPSPLHNVCRMYIIQY